MLIYVPTRIDLLLDIVPPIFFIRVNYCCRVLYTNTYGLQMKRLQKLMNEYVRISYGLSKPERVTSFMKQCHFLPVKYRIIYKLCIFVFRALHGVSP